MNKKKNIIIIGSIIVIIIGLIVVLFSINLKKDYAVKNENDNIVETVKTIDDLLTEKGMIFYESYYNGIIDIESLSNFSEIGISVNLNQLDMVVAFEDNIKQILDDKICDYETSKLIFYPEKPFGIKNYKIKVELKCQK